MAATSTAPTGDVFRAEADLPAATDWAAVIRKGIIGVLAVMVPALAAAGYLLATLESRRVEAAAKARDVARLASQIELMSTELSNLHQGLSEQEADRARQDVLPRLGRLEADTQALDGRVKSAVAETALLRAQTEAHLRGLDAGVVEIKQKFVDLGLRLGKFGDDEAALDARVTQLAARPAPRLETVSPPLVQQIAAKRRFHHVRALHAQRRVPAAPPVVAPADAAPSNLWEAHPAAWDVHPSSQGLN